MTDAQVAKRLGVSRARARELANEPGFPAAVAHVGSAPLWPWSRVQRWAREQSSQLAA